MVALVAVVLVAGCVSQQAQPAAPSGPAGEHAAPPAPTGVSIGIVNYASSVNVSMPFNITWRINSPSVMEVTHTAVYYGLHSVASPRIRTEYSKASPGQYGEAPGTFSMTLLIAPAGTYYFRALAVVNGSDVWSDEKVLDVRTVPLGPSLSYSLQADDDRFYYTGDPVSSINVSRGSRITFTFETMGYASHDFIYSSNKFSSPAVPPAQSWTTPEIVIDGPLMISSFWSVAPSPIKRADLQIIIV